jgi:uncharacterized protein (TIGR00369 family)
MSFVPHSTLGSLTPPRRRPASSYARVVIADEPLRGRFAYLEHPRLLGLSGLEQMRRFLRKEIPYAPLYFMFGTDFVDATLGTSTWKLPVTPWLQSSAGVLTGGVMAFIADAALGGALYTTFPPNTVLATSELSMNFLRPPGPDTEAIIARAKLIQAGRSQGLTEASVEDADGRLLAHATSRCVIMPLPGPVPDPLPDEPIPWPVYDGPHPYQRPAEGEVIAQDVWDRMSGLEMMRAWRRGELPMSPLSILLDEKAVDCAEGRFACAMPASQWLCTAGGTFYGGAVALLADWAMHGAVHTTLDAGTSWGTLDLKVNFLRPVVPDGRDLEARAQVVHRGKTIAVTTAEVVGADGKTVALATSSAMLMPGRPWQPTRPAAPIDDAPAVEETAADASAAAEGA